MGETWYPVYCCRGCGADTTYPGGYCADCGGLPGEHTSRMQTIDHRTQMMGCEDLMEHEDRYDEESGPSSICCDQDPLDRGYKMHPEYYRHYHKAKARRQ